jgi:hypothetical protein
MRQDESDDPREAGALEAFIDRGANRALRVLCAERARRATGRSRAGIFERSMREAAQTIMAPSAKRATS